MGDDRLREVVAHGGSTVFRRYANFLENFGFDPKPLSGADQALVLLLNRSP